MGVCKKAEEGELASLSATLCTVSPYIWWVITAAFLHTSSAPGRTVDKSKELSLMRTPLAMVPWCNLPYEECEEKQTWGRERGLLSSWKKIRHKYLLRPVFGRCHVKPWTQSCCSPIRITRRMQKNLRDTGLDLWCNAAALTSPSALDLLGVSCFYLRLQFIASCNCQYQNKTDNNNNKHPSSHLKGNRT